jgi:hypothetical protein
MSTEFNQQGELGLVKISVNSQVTYDIYEMTNISCYF